MLNFCDFIKVYVFTKKILMLVVILVTQKALKSQTTIVI